MLHCFCQYQQCVFLDKTENITDIMITKNSNRSISNDCINNLKQAVEHCQSL